MGIYGKPGINSYIRIAMSAKYLSLIIFLIAVAQYANTFSGSYAWDDKLVITGNEYTQRGISALPDIFAHRVSVPNKNVYRPFPQALFAIEHDLFNGDPRAGHFFNIVWYAFLCVLVFHFIRFVFPDARPAFAFFSALLFTVHPLHVEVVANIKSRDEILALFFGLSALILLVRAIEKNKPLLFLSGALCFGLALLSKENSICLLPVGALMAYYRSDQIGKNWNFRRILPLLILGLAITGWLIYSVRATRSASVRLDATVLNNIFLWTSNGDKVTPTAIALIGRYLVLFVYPHPLLHMYGYNQVGLSGWGSPETIGMLIVLALTAFFVFRNWRKKGVAVFGILFSAITFSIYSNLFVLAPDTMADRYLFTASLGLALIAVNAAFRLVAMLSPKSQKASATSQKAPATSQKASAKSPKPSPTLAKTAIATGCCVLGAYFVRTIVANTDWENDFTLIYHRIRYMENNAAAQATYGYMLEQESLGLPPGEQRSQKKAEAVSAFEAAVSIYPDFAMPWTSMGRIFAQQGIYDKAELCFLKAMAVAPTDPDVFFYLGSLHYTTGDGGMAISYLEKTVLLNPSNEQAYILLGRSYLQSNSLAELGSMAETAIKWFPRNGDITALMAAYYFRTGHNREAQTYVGKALQLDPRNVTALSLRALLPVSR
jgi:tetratricopeptide (TPR) repeat protein